MKQVKQKSFFLNSIVRILALFLITFVSFSCADTQDSGQSCEVRLDEQKYQSVAENTNCSNYERASGYLGQSGVSFSNFLKTGAADNMTKTIGIKKLSSPTDYTTGNRGYITNALCLIGANTFLTSSRCNGSSRTRTTDELEISMFANIADFLYLNYGVLDNDSNGTISSEEGAAFTKLKTEGISVAGLGTGLSAYNRYEVVAGSSHYIANQDLTKCIAYNGNYTDDPSSGDGTCATLQAAGSVTELRPIFKLDDMVDITADGDLLTLVSMVSELTMISTALSSDFEELGISSDNSIRQSLTEALNKIDNGAKDNNPTADQACVAVILFDVMFLLVKNASDNSTTSDELKSGNLISTTDLLTAVDSSLSLLPAGASDAIKLLPMQSARIVYAKDSGGTTHTDSYEAAESSLYTAIANTRSLGTEDSVKSDGKVTFRELICVAEN